MLKTPEELAHVREKHEYLRELQKAADVSPLDWTEEEGTLVYRVGKLTLVIAHNTRSNSYEWLLLHERSGRLTSGSSEDQSIAQQEAVAYAKNYVCTAMVGVMA